MAKYIELEDARNAVDEAIELGKPILLALESIPAADVIDRETAEQMLEAEADKIISSRIYNITKAGAFRSAAAMIRRIGKK